MVQFNKQTFRETRQKLWGEETFDLPLDYFPSLPSTNQKLWQLLNEGKPLPRVVIAGQQTAGKGQWGRQWQSSLGGLYLSLALSTQLPATNSHQLTLCSGWGIAQALRSKAVRVNLKWPNDLLLNQKKLGGILSETRIQNGHITQAVIGVGINWQNSVPETGINLQPRSQITSLESLAAVVAHGIIWGYQQYLAIGIEKILPSYLQMLSSKGRKVLVDGFPGTVVGVTAQGDLKIRLNSLGAGVEVLRSPGTISLSYR
ncbi:MAG: biotin--[acetyl-CoA-carboxylase] ligase [Spirulinaceae cyanobacterium]